MDDTEPEPAVGDAACWLGRVCDDCGALDEGPEPGVCRRCGRAVAR